MTWTQRTLEYWPWINFRVTSVLVDKILKSITSLGIADATGETMYLSTLNIFVALYQCRPAAPTCRQPYTFPALSKKKYIVTNTVKYRYPFCPLNTVKSIFMFAIVQFITVKLTVYCKYFYRILIFYTV